MDKKKVLMVGENPDSFTGNGNMMGACLEDINPNFYDIFLFLKNDPSPLLMGDPFEYESTFNCKYMSSTHGNDPWGKEKLLQLLQVSNFDIVVFVGIDIWKYIDIFEDIRTIQEHKKFTWKMLVPYDLDHIRDDWIMWFNFPDQVYVYSRFGYNMIKNYVSSSKYFRPKLRFSELYDQISYEEKDDYKKLIFKDVPNDVPIFGFIANNQVRKNIYNTIKGFSKALHIYNKNMILYIHTDDSRAAFGIDRIRQDLKIPEYNLRCNQNIRKLIPNEMMIINSVIDCHVLASIQEGLSWTVVESKLGGVPSIISASTAHYDFINMVETDSKINSKNTLIEVETDHEHIIPLITKDGPGYLMCRACSSEAIANGFLQYFERNMFKNKEVYDQSRMLGKKWIKNTHNFQKQILDDSVEKKENFGEMI